MGKYYNMRNRAMDQITTTDSITLGTVVDTNDPQQMGRLKILCPSLGDDNQSEATDHLPWCTYVSPLGGMTNSPNVTRGPNDGNTTAGPMAYGLWGIPRRGSTVLVCCIDGDPYYRVWLGSVFDQGSTSTLPHGRFFYQANSSLPGSGTPEGPLDGYQNPIEPLYTNSNQAYGGKSGNYEWRTRGADYSVGGNSTNFASQAPSTVVDETASTPFTSADGKTFNVQNGYAVNRNPNFAGAEESSIYSWTSPGFHSIAMDDRPENCRVRIRTTSGTQILLDDTNERIYINNALGTNWLQMDYDGNIDVYAQMRINLHAEADVNIQSDQSVRIYGKQGIYLNSPGEIIEQGATHQIKTSGDIIHEAGGNHSTKGTILTHEGSGAVNIKAGGDLLLTGATVHFNGPEAASAQSAGQAKVPSRSPQHEPWARTSNSSDFSLTPKYGYDDPNVGTEDKVRGKYWRR